MAWAETTVKPAKPAKPAKESVPTPGPLATLATKSIPVKLNGQEFTSYIWQGLPRPVLFPIIGPHELSMTRHWPLIPGNPAEETDHPHHQSLWFTHGDINGIDFWTVGPKAGKVIVDAEPTVTTKDGATTIVSQETWQGPDGKKILASTTTITCLAEQTDRIIDYKIVLAATDGDLTFGDTKEGTMALRVRPELNLPNKKGLATITNSAGQTGEAAWGKHAAWVDYSAPISGHTVGIACFDHTSNFRHPTTWHARDYGLFAANPFGLHDFEKAPAGTGKHVVKAGEKLSFHYRWLFHEGDAASADLPKKFAKWILEK
jgi:hypothetical protein